MQAADPILFATLIAVMGVLLMPLRIALMQGPSLPCPAVVRVCQPFRNFSIRTRVQQAVQLTALLPQRAPPARPALSLVEGLCASPTFPACRRVDPDPIAGVIPILRNSWRSRHVEC